jgi:hypothetical protein
MRVKMLYTRRGSYDGFTIKRYIKGETYDLPGMLAQSFLDEGAAYNAEPFDDDTVKTFYITVTTTTSELYEVKAINEDEAESNWAEGHLIDKFGGDPVVTEVNETDPRKTFNSIAIKESA